MGRKIPAKKHRGVKDPLEQQARRLQTLKSKINAPPLDPDEQPVPRSLTRLFAFQHRRSQPDTPRQHKQDNNKQIKERGGMDNPVLGLRAAAGESAREFSLRINSAVRALAAPANDYPPDVEDESDWKGSRMSELRARRLRRQRRAAARPPAAGSRTHRLELKNKARKEKAEEAALSRREVRYERVPFGEVTHAPPARLAPPRRAPPSEGGARRGLLLSALVRGGGGGGGGAGEGARLQAVAAYRALKAARAAALPPRGARSLI